MQTVLAFIFGTLASILATAFFEWLKRPTLSIVPENAPYDMQYPAGHPIAQKARFLRVRVTNRQPPRSFRWLSRHAALTCEADVTFLHLDQHDVFGKAILGRWSGWPEPLAFVGEIGGQHVSLINPYFMAPQYQQQPIDVPQPHSWFTRRARLETENVILRQQLVVLRLKSPERRGWIIYAEAKSRLLDGLRLSAVLSQNLNPDVLKMESTEDWYRCDAAELLWAPQIGRILCARISAAVRGRPPRWRDFQRQ
jgi:hypothetical protein